MPLIRLPYRRVQVSVLYTPWCIVRSDCKDVTSILADGKGSRRNLKKATKAGKVLLQRNDGIHSTDVSAQPGS